MVVALCQRTLGTPGLLRYYAKCNRVKTLTTVYISPKCWSLLPTTWCPNREAYNMNLHQHKYLSYDFLGFREAEAGTYLGVVVELWPGG